MHKINLRSFLAGINVFIALLLLDLITVSDAALAGAAGQTVAAPHALVEKSQDRSKQLDKIVLAKLAFYASHYPDIDFVVLDSAGDVAKNMQILAKIIGEEANPLDYAHPADLRHPLLMSALVRIEFMLETDIGSATLFAPGKGALARRKQVCVITLNPFDAAADDRAATRNLLEIPQREFELIPRAHYLAHDAHLRFVLDHEVYHCLDTHYNGPIPMSHEPHWGDYHMLRNEAGADAFGVLMNIAAHAAVTPYVRILKLIRGLTLLDEDPDHYTYPAIAAALQVEPRRVVRADVQARFQLATRIRDKVVGSYSDYVHYAAAAERAMCRLGVPPRLAQYNEIKVGRARVEALVAQTRSAYQQLTGHPLPATQK